jgi:hypothetical protein
LLQIIYNLFFIKTILFVLLRTSKHADSKLCPEHCEEQAKAVVELCGPALLLKSRRHIQTTESQNPALLCTAWAALHAYQCTPGLHFNELRYLSNIFHVVQNQQTLYILNLPDVMTYARAALSSPSYVAPATPVN